MDTPTRPSLAATVRDELELAPATVLLLAAAAGAVARLAIRALTHAQWRAGFDAGYRAGSRDRELAREAAGS